MSWDETQQVSFLLFHTARLCTWSRIRAFNSKDYQGRQGNIDCLVSTVATGWCSSLPSCSLCEETVRIRTSKQHRHRDRVETRDLHLSLRPVSSCLLRGAHSAYSCPLVIWCYLGRLRPGVPLTSPIFCLASNISFTPSIRCQLYLYTCPRILNPSAARGSS
jgi:hypothetical protein